MMKRLFILPLLMLLCLVPMLPAQAASKAEITSVRTATRNDANVPFVRTVLELDSKVTPRLFIDEDGKYVTVTLPNAKIAKNVEKKYNADRNVVSRISLSQRSSGTDVNIKVPRAVTKSDVNVFTLPGTDKAKRNAASSSTSTTSRARSSSGCTGMTLRSALTIRPSARPIPSRCRHTAAAVRTS